MKALLPEALTTGGSAPGWSASSGNPVLLSGISGSQDGWGMAISGNASGSDILSSVETVCLPASENGTLSLRIKPPKRSDIRVTRMKI